MVEFGVQIPMAPFDSLRSLMAGQQSRKLGGMLGTKRVRAQTSSESNALSLSKGLPMSASASADSFFVYIVCCADDSLYVGHTANVTERVKTHSEGRGALWTARRRPVALVYQEQRESEESAIARERQIKGWTCHGAMKLAKAAAIMQEGIEEPSYMMVASRCPRP